MYVCQCIEYVIDDRDGKQIYYKTRTQIEIK